MRSFPSQSPGKPRRLVWVVVSALVLWAMPPRLQAQQDDEVIRVNADQVILNVTVTDRAGKYVPGLRNSDFKIYEDGKEEPATAISGFSLQETPFASVVLLDTSGSMEKRLVLARSAAIR